MAIKSTVHCIHVYEWFIHFINHPYMIKQAKSEFALHSSYSSASFVRQIRDEIIAQR